MILLSRNSANTIHVHRNDFFVGAGEVVVALLENKATGDAKAVLATDTSMRDDFGSYEFTEGLPENPSTGTIRLIEEGEYTIALYAVPAFTANVATLSPGWREKGVLNVS